MTPPSAVRMALSLIAAAGIAAMITILSLSMRAVMSIGGTCASGGPYEIRVQCPDSINWLMPVSVMAGVAFLLLFLATSPVEVRPWVVLAWTGLFGALGWNFIDAGLPWHGQSFAAIGIVLGAVFWAMAIAPLPFLFRRGGRSSPPTTMHIQRTMFSNGTTPQFGITRPPPTVTRSTDLSGALERLADLHRSGELSDDEYSQAKAALLKGYE